MEGIRPLKRKPPKEKKDEMMETMEMTTNDDSFWRALGPRKRKHDKKKPRR